MKTLEITVRDKSLRNIENFSVQEEATPIDPSSSFGGVGQITFDALEEDDSRLFIGTVTLVDGIRGKTSGAVKTVSGTNGKLSVTADSILGLFNVDRTVPPFQGTLSDAINYYCDFVGIPNGVTVDSSISARSVIYPGWKGNVWVGIKQILAKEQVEMALVFDRIYVRPLRSLVAQLDRSTSSSFSIDSTNAARSVDIKYFNHVYGLQKEVYPPSLDEAIIYQVDAGETVVFQERLSASLFSVNQPAVQDWVDDARYDDTDGVYSVVGNDGLPITAAQWSAQGGYISVSLTDDPSIIEVSIRGANMPDYAPYRIAMSSGSGNYYNSLHITGEAVVMSEETINIKTGITNTVSSDEVGIVVDNPFIQTKEQAYSLGMLVAGAYSGLNYTVSGAALDLNRGEGSGEAILATISDFNLAITSGTTIATFNTEWATQDIADFNIYWQEQVDALFGNQLFGNAVGARVKTPEVNFRITSATTKTDLIDYSANLDTIVSDFNETWPESSVASVRTNLCTDPRFTGTWSTVGSTLDFSGDGVLITATGAVTTRAGTNRTEATHRPAGAYTVSVDTDVLSAKVANIQVMLYDSTVSTSRGFIHVPVSSAEPRTVATITASDQWNRIYLDALGTGFTAGDQVLALDRVLIESGSSVGEYFDGSLVDTSTIIYAWTGTENNSTSTETVLTAPPNTIAAFNSDFAGYTCKDFSIRPLRRL